MTKKFFAILIATIMCFAFAVSVSADDFQQVERTLPLVVDNADILSESLEESLNERCEAISAEYEMEIAIVTVNDFDGKTSQSFADDFYDYNGYGWGENDDGMLVVYNPGTDGNREIAITTHGEGDSVFFEGIVNGIIDEMVDPLIDEDYEKAFNIYLDRAEQELKPGIPFMWLFILMIFGAVIGILVVNSMISKNKTIFAQKNAKIYTRQGSMAVTGSTDTFLYSTVRVQPKPQQSSSGGTHTSSSGRSHGGASRRF